MTPYNPSTHPIRTDAPVLEFAPGRIAKSLKEDGPNMGKTRSAARKAVAKTHAPRTTEKMRKRVDFRAAFKKGPSDGMKLELDRARKDIQENISKPSADGSFKSRLLAYLYASRNCLPGYATLRFRHVKEIYDVVESIAAYSRDTTLVRPLNFLLLADPGSGKSQLVKSIAKKLTDSPVAIVSFNMATMNTKADLVRVLDTARNHVVDGKMPLVFLDEFDSHDSHYPLLLPLLWDGELDVGSGDLRVGKSVFFLAGSRSSLPRRLEAAREMHGRQAKKEDDKLVDLFSRINGRVVRVPSLANDHGDTTTEEVVNDTAADKVVIAMHLLRQRFKSCEVVPRSILTFVANTEFRYEARSIATLINQISLLPNEDGNQVSRLTKEHLETLPLSTADALKNSPLTFHLLHEEGGRGLLDAWNEAAKIDEDQMIYDRQMEEPGWEDLASTFIYGPGPDTASAPKKRTAPGMKKRAAAKRKRAAAHSR